MGLIIAPTFNIPSPLIGDFGLKKRRAIMPSNKVQIKVYVTDEQRMALDLVTELSGLSASEARREAFRMFCAKYGVDFPHNMPIRGTYERKDSK
jgi:hypothetical protein